MFIIIILNELIKYFNNFPILISNTINVNSDIHIYRSSSGSLIIFKSKNQPQSKNLKNQWSRGFPGDSVVKNPPANAGDACSVPGLGRCNMLPALEQLSPVLQLLSLCSRAGSHSYWRLRALVARLRIKRSYRDEKPVRHNQRLAPVYCN